MGEMRFVAEMMSTSVCCREETATAVPLISTMMSKDDKSMFPIALVIEGVQKTKIRTPTARTIALTVVLQTPLVNPAIRPKTMNSSRTARTASVMYVTIFYLL